jgi:hypothetical protein
MMARTWFLPDSVSKAILYCHDKAVFTVPDARFGRNIVRQIGTVNMAEMLVDEHFCQDNQDRDDVATEVLHYFGMPEQDFAELKGDTLGWLNQE